MLVQSLLDQVIQAVSQADGEMLERLVTGLASVQMMALVRIVGRPAANPESWLTVEQAAREFGLSRRWIYRHARCQWVSRPSPHVLRISRRGLMDYMEAQRGGTSNGAGMRNFVPANLQRARRR